MKLSEGSGGREMHELVDGFMRSIRQKSNWSESDNDSAVIRLGSRFLVFTTDSFIVDPLFFPGGDIGKLAVCGTINDLAVMGAKPIGLSLAMILEEGFPKNDLNKIMLSISSASKKCKVPVVTGDTKVMEKGKLDKLVINTAGVGLANFILNKKIEPGDKVIVSGGVGEHAAALLSRRYDFETSVISDCQSVYKEMDAVKKWLKLAKDPTRGGLASALNEIALKNKAGILIDEEKVPVHKEVKAAAEFLGLSFYELACEGRFVCIVSNSHSGKVLSALKKFNKNAAIIGEVIKGKEVIIKTRFGKRILSMPSGNLVPRIC